ncbi:MAG TPA: bacterial proteasome activator family protein [Acidimicrobiales bacterium]
MSSPDQGTPSGGAARPSVEHPEVVTGPDGGIDGNREGQEAVEQPAKVMRIGSMIKLLLEEVRQAELDEASRDRLREIYETSVSELSHALSPDLQEELNRLAHPFQGTAAPSEAELRIVKAQLVGWLEGLFHGIQATLFAQQMAARQQLEEMRRRLPPGTAPGTEAESRPGTYL